MSRKIVIVGSGPVGSFMAVLCSLLGREVIVYEKRPNFSRMINVKLEYDFFERVHEMLQRLNIKSDFFLEISILLQRQNGSILIKDFEKKFSSKAQSLGAVYLTKDVKSFNELYEEHKESNPIILDCGGRSSLLRVNEFGSDETNMMSVPLQNCMHINFKAKLKGPISLYQASKHIKNIKFSEIVVGRTDQLGYSDVTIPIFITKDMGKAFDNEFPDINRNPLKPFNTTRQISETLFYPIAAVMGNIIIDGHKVDLNNVVVKKIVIMCGYAKRRSNDNLVSLGDSAVHLGFFRSVTFGLNHALELFIKISMIENENRKVPDDLLTLFKKDNPYHGVPVDVHPTEARNVFLVVSRVLTYGCWKYCYTTRRTEKITDKMGVSYSHTHKILLELNRNLKSWSYLMLEYEKMRDADIALAIKKNKDVSAHYDHISWLANMCGKSQIIKVSELVRVVYGKQAIFKNNFDFMSRKFLMRKLILNSNGNNFDGKALAVLISALIILCDHPDLRKVKEIALSANMAENEKFQKLAYALDLFNPQDKKVNFETDFLIKIIRNEIHFSRDV